MSKILDYIFFPWYIAIERDSMSTSNIDRSCRLDTKISLEDIKGQVDNAPSKLEGLNIENEFMQAAFEFVAPKPDWKAPIDTLVSDYSCPYAPEVLARAIWYMTSTVARVVEVKKAGNPAHRFIADGYRQGPAA